MVCLSSFCNQLSQLDNATTILTVFVVVTQQPSVNEHGYHSNPIVLLEVDTHTSEKALYTEFILYYEGQSIKSLYYITKVNVAHCYSCLQLNRQR